MDEKVEVLGISVVLGLKYDICPHKEFRSDIAEGFKSAVETIPGCLWAPEVGCVNAEDPRTLKHVSVFKDKEALGQYMSGLHKEVAKKHAHHVDTHSFAQFAITGELASALLSPQGLAQEYLDELHDLGEQALLKKT